MGRDPHHHQKDDERERAFRVVDDFPAPAPVGAAELDAIEAFLMPLVKAILANGPDAQAAGRPTSLSDSTPPQRSASRKR
jgi:hypothetical protein